MTKEETIKPQDTEELSQEEVMGINDIDALITSGIDHTVIIKVNYLGNEFAVKIHPLNASTFNTIQNEYLKTKRSPDLKICLKGMIKGEDDVYTSEELLRLPAGVISSIAQEISVISGQVQNTNVDQNEVIKDIMGF